MEDLSVQSATKAIRLNPVMQSSNTKLEEERLKQTVVQPKPQREEAEEKDLSANANQVVQEVNKIVEKFNSRVSFSVDPDTKKTMILVKDKETGDVIRQIPAKEMLDLMKKMEEIAGIIYSGRV